MGQGSTWTRRGVVGRTWAGVVALVAALALIGCSGGGDEPAEPSVPAPGADGGGGGDEEESAFDDAEVLLADEMEDDENGWGEIENEYFSTRFDDGAFEIEPITDERPIAFYADALGTDVLDSQITITAEAEPDDGGEGRLGAYCRSTTTGAVEYYTLAVDRDTGDWSIDRWLDDAEAAEVTNLAEGTDEAIAGDGPVEIVATCSGEEGDEVLLTLEVDGEPVGEAEDEDGLGAGLAGVVAGLTSDEGSYVARFDEVEIRGTRAEEDEGSDDEASEDGVVYFDDFSDPDSGFQGTDESPGLAAYVDETWGMGIQGVAGSPGFTLRSPVPVASPPDALGVDVTTVVESESQAWAGVCVGTADAAYAFEVTPAGGASITRLTSGGADVLDELASHPAIESSSSAAGGGSNAITLTVDASDPGEVVTTMSVNGEPLLEAVDGDPLEVQEVALCITKSSQSPVDAVVQAQFDDVLVFDLA